MHAATRCVAVLIVALLVSAESAEATRWLLVDFHDSDSQSTFGAQYPTWNQIIRNTTYTEYVAPDPNDPNTWGVACKEGTSTDEQNIYFGIKGTSPIDFQPPHRIVATFYSRYVGSMMFTARCSLTDEDEPITYDWDHAWNTMYQAEFRKQSIPGHTFVEVYLNVTTPTTMLSPHAVPNQGQHYCINVGLKAYEPDLVLTKIELSDEADLTKPNAPVNLQANTVSMSAEADASVVELTWTAPTDPPGANGVSTGISRYLVYRNGEINGEVSRELTGYYGSSLVYRDYAVVPGAAYTYEVRAIDGSEVGWFTTPDNANDTRFGNVGDASSVPITVPSSIDHGSTLIDPLSDLVHQGGFTLPSAITLSSWNSAGTGLTFYPGGNPGYDPATELPGSLYGVGKYTEQAIGEITIPKPVATGDPVQMNRATQLQDFVWPYPYTPSGSNTLWAHIGYHPGGNGVGPMIHYGLYRFYAGKLYDPAHGALNLDLDSGGAGAWFIGDDYGEPDHVLWAYTAKHIFQVPQSWADAHTGGRSLVVGYGGGGLAGQGSTPAMGPTMYATAPWESGSLPSHLGWCTTVEMLKYGDQAASPSIRWDRCTEKTFYGDMDWIEDGGKRAFIVVANQVQGDTWYGGLDGECSTYIAADLPKTNSTAGSKGYNVTRQRGLFYFYNVKDIERVVAGTLQPHEPRPYAAIDIQDLFINQKTARYLGHHALAVDWANGYLYAIIEDDENGNLSLIHVWKVESGAGPVNNAPSVDAGGDQAITLPTDTVNLDGTVSDDGLPDPPAAVTTSWTKFSGPGTVTFGDPNAVDTTATFSTDGVYVLQLEADDSELTATDTVTITVNPEAGSGDEIAYWDFEDGSGSTLTDVTGNGSDGTITGAVWAEGYYGGALQFDGDDQVDGDFYATADVAGPISVAVWVYNDIAQSNDTVVSLAPVSGSGLLNMLCDGRVMAYGDALVVASSVTPPSQAWYHLCYTNDGTTHRIYVDGVDRGSSTTAVTAGPAELFRLGNRVKYGGRYFYGRLDDARVYDRELSPGEVDALYQGVPANTAPTVDAGSDQMITLPTDTVDLDGTVSDDGLPDPPAMVTTLWTKFSGPGTVTFGDPNAVDTTATFSTDGVYVLQLEADDSELTAADTVTITVEPAGGPTDMIAHWDFEDGSGSTLTDVTGNGSDGTITGAVWAEGYYGGALQFDGDDEVTGSFAATLDTASPMTLAVWVYCDITPTNDSVLGVGPDSGTGLVNMYCDGRVMGYGDVLVVGSSVTPPPQAWYHLCYTYDGTTHRIYLDGVDRGSSTTSVASGAVTMFAIGNRVKYGGRYFYGRIDEARVYDRALSPGEVDALYQGVPANAAPTVEAGSDQTITLPTDTVDLDGTVSDDGLPDPPAMVTTLWTKFSGPGTVTFGDPNAVDTTATFSTDGVYVLELAADDSALQSSDTVTVTVDPEPLPTVAFDATSSSGDESVATVNLSVSLSAAYQTGIVTVDYMVTGGTAVDPNDYTIAASPLTFDPGVTQQNVVMTVVDDGLVESDETIEVTLSSPVNATLGANTVHTYTINDNDVYPTVQFDLTGSSGDESVATVNLSVSLSAAYEDVVTVDFAVTGGTAVDPNDYTIAASPLTFNPGATSEDIVLSVVDDGLDESDETVEVSLSTPSNATLGTNTVHTYTILDNDLPPNAAPTVDAGSDQTITLPAAATLDGTVSDDGLPDPPGVVTTTWSKVSGPGTVTFGDPNAVDTTAAFSTDGVYVLQLEANDSELTATDTVTITVEAAGGPTDMIAYWDFEDGSGSTLTDVTGNGSDGTITGAVWAPGYLGGALEFDGVDDMVDGGFDATLNLTGAMSMTAWVYAEGSQTTVPYDAVLGLAPSSGAAIVQVYSNGRVIAYGDRLLVNSSLIPSTLEWYHLAYTYDGTTHRVYINGVDYGSSAEAPDTGPVEVFRIGDRVRYGGRPFDGRIDDARVYDRALAPGEVDALYNNVPVTNAAPTVEAGSDQTITLPTDMVNLDGTVSDDGLPDPPATVTTLWSKVSGPGTVTFGDPNAVDTTATFSIDGVYMLKLEAEDSELTGSDTVTITVDPEPLPMVGFDSTSSSGDESLATVNLSVSLSASYSEAVTVPFAVTGGTAVDPNDFTLAASPLTFDPGVTQQNVVITVVDDGLVESDETIEVTLSDPVNATLGANTVHTYTVHDNDAPPPPGQASDPSPADGATKVAMSGTVLSWTAGSDATSHDVYFGTNPSPGASEFQGNQAGTTFDPGDLAKLTWYYWRIDEVNANGTTTGVVWSFKTGNK